MLTCSGCNNTAGTALDAHAVSRRHLEDFTHRRATGHTLPVTVHADGIHYAAPSWIRAAYLAAFAALGWHYIFRPVMDVYPSSSANRTPAVMPVRVFRDRTALADQRRILIVVDQPDDLRAVAVSLSQRLVMPPGIDRPQTCHQLHDAIAARGSGGESRADLQGKEVPWPPWATYLLDHYAPNRHNK